MIETQQLLLMQTLFRCSGNLTQAAQTLHLSQPAISKQIKQLEAQLGLTLIERDKRPARFTQAGKVLLSLAEVILPLQEQCERRLNELKEGYHQQLRIAVECDICYDWLMPAMSAYQQLWPSVDMDLVTGQQATPQSLIHDDKADFVLATQLPSENYLSGHILFDYELQAVVSINHPLADNQFLTAEDFASVCLLHFPSERKRLDIFSRVLMPANIEPKQTRTHHLALGLLQLVAASKGVAAMPSWALKKLPENFPVAIKPITEQGTWITLYAITQAEHSGKIWLRDFVRLIREQQRK